MISREQLSGIILSLLLISTAMLTLPLWGPYIEQATPKDVPDQCAMMFKNGTVISGGGNAICVIVVDADSPLEKMANVSCEEIP